MLSYCIYVPDHVLRITNANEKKWKLVTVDVVSAAGASLPKAETVSFTEGVDVWTVREREKEAEAVTKQLNIQR